jgi:hypothetical protein
MSGLLASWACAFRIVLNEPQNRLRPSQVPTWENDTYCSIEHDNYEILGLL